MTSRELQIFMAVVEYGKMSEAARRLYITQSSVSQAVASIEREYGILLFNRLSNGLFPTADGERLYAYARNFFAVKNDMDEFLASASHKHSLNVGATVTVGSCIISQVLHSVKEVLPGIELNVNVANTHILEEMLLKSKIDVGLVEGRVTDPDLVCRDAIEDTLVLICAPDHPFFGRDRVGLDELSGQSFILREKGSGTRALFETQMNNLQLPMKVTWSCYNSEAIRSAVSEGFGISVISSRLVENEVKQGRLWACDIEKLDLRRHFSVVYHKNKVFSPAMETFIQACEDFARREAEA